ncbi:uncharacterized protein DFR58_12327 [Anaerobacterium chartisolvens]|uniref:Radical SAM core domain-containing protein n=1 Tax=Anaerobacterium chartisolvens TaxID=1297424 RepID=A0A369AVH6_9FIRM|nr:Cys-rich peptide radical SAM maturase CcpM [Anaerobacterium chartisolvens]RCX12217.1 uncharacterized protein DFR58_12327 [Anaerobacterium chartisolvens]
MIDMPFIRLFKTVGSCYVFDVNTTSIIRIEAELYKALKGLNEGRIGWAQIDDGLMVKLQKLLMQGFFKPCNLNTEIKHSAADQIEEYMENNIHQLILQVTQNCNLRCKYCVYSGSYINRVHTKKRMSLEMAKKAVDFYHNHNGNLENAIISFYGGEPLLEIKLIREIIAYAKKVFEGKKLRLNMTTNATLLTDEIVDLLEQNDVSLTISLDGPQKIQDSSRIFAESGRGTFEVIMDNLERIRQKHPEYMENISFNAVLNEENDFQCSSNFFTYDFVHSAIIGATTLNENSVKEELRYNEIFDINYRYELFKAYLFLIGRLEKKYVSKLMEAQIAVMKENIHKKIVAKGKRGTKYHPSGACIAGATRLFVNTDGDLFPCERINESCQAFVLGNLETGFDIDKVKKLLNIAALTPEECKTCWAGDFCNVCAAGMEKGNELSAEKRIERCKKVKEASELQLKEYCTLREHGYHFD